MNTDLTLTPQAEHYLRRLRQGLASLTVAERDDIVNEIRSHLAERLSAGTPNILAGFEEPESYAAKFVSDYALGGALARGTSLELGRALLTGTRSGLLALTALLAVAPLFSLEFIGAVLVVLGCAKPFFPSHIGVFRGAEGAFMAGAHFGHSAPLTDILGWWAMPVFIVTGIIMIFLCNRALRALARLKLHRGADGPPRGAAPTI